MILDQIRLRGSPASCASLLKIVIRKFECDQCDFEAEAQRGLRVHIGWSHKDPEVLCEELEVSLVISDPGDVARAGDSFVNVGNSFTEAETKISLESAHPHSVPPTLLFAEKQSVK